MKKAWQNAREKIVCQMIPIQIANFEEMAGQICKILAKKNGKLYCLKAHCV